MALPPADVVIVGTALDTFGQTANNTVAGLGLNTLGFLWPCDGIWEPSDNSTLKTTWVRASQPVVTTETCLDDNGGLFA